ncbi:MAG TPA: patatin-like phospholipase family protein [Gammaproteobacteria bacterium]|jgi:NTE family protein|nr:patatin-like phospholipase family protein [Gammaproteobacteria bacterium]
MSPATPARPKVGLVLPGGGARAAYQVGVLKALAELLPQDAPTPFPIIAGTSAGAINAAMLASHAQNFRAGVAYLDNLWREIHSDQVFKTGVLTALKTGSHWFFTLLSGGMDRHNPISLLDNAPLRELLRQHIVFEQMDQAIDAGVLDALAITASGYTSARSISFFQARADLKPWHRERRFGEPVETMSLDHVMASVALPVIFPAIRIGREYFGDGSMRQSAPLSPVVHLGAEKVLVIALRNEQPNRLPLEEEMVPYPSLGQIAGYLLDTLFMDSIYGDLERLQRINSTVSRIQARPGEEQPLKVIDTMVITPSEDIRDIAQRHKDEFPRSVKFLLRGVGGLHKSGSQLLSYLLFEGKYCRDLIDLGMRDAQAQADKLLEFIGESVTGKTGS